MVTRVTAFLNGAKALVPNFGKTSAAVFTTVLVLEYMFRTITIEKHHTTAFLNKMQALKGVQSSIVLGAFGLNSKELLVGSIALAALQALPLHALIAKSTGVTRASTGGPSKNYVRVEADRPPLVSFIQVAGEMVNIACKVLGSLATGVVVHKMFPGDTIGRSGAIVSLWLLTFSALNVKNVFEVYVQSK